MGLKSSHTLVYQYFAPNGDTKVGSAPFIRPGKHMAAAPSQNTWAVLILQQASKALHQRKQ